MQGKGVTMTHLLSVENKCTNTIKTIVRHNSETKCHLKIKFCTDDCFMRSFQKQSFRGVLSKRCSENMQQFYRRTPMPKWVLNKIFGTSFTKNTSGWLLLKLCLKMNWNPGRAPLTKRRSMFDTRQ